MLCKEGVVDHIVKKQKEALSAGGGYLGGQCPSVKGDLSQGRGGKHRSDYRAGPYQRALLKSPTKEPY